MKKLLILLGILTFVGASSYAYYYEDETLDIKALEAQGYSDSLIKVTDKIHDFNTGINGKYKRVYKKHPKNFLGKSYTYLKDYVDPAQDDGMFGEHQINFSNSWNPERIRYATPEKQPKGEVENL